MNSEAEKPKSGSISIPRGLLEDIKTLVEELGLWSSRAAFIHEATREKVRREWPRLAPKPG